MTPADEAALAQLREAWAAMEATQQGGMRAGRTVWLSSVNAERYLAFIAAAIRLAEGEK